MNKFVSSGSVFHHSLSINCSHICTFGYKGSWISWERSANYRTGTGLDACWEYVSLCVKLKVDDNEVECGDSNLEYNSLKIRIWVTYSEVLYPGNLSSMFIISNISKNSTQLVVN